MPQKASSWYIAATHYLSSIFIGNIVLVGIGTLLPELSPTIESIILLTVINAFSLGLGVWYSSARVLKNKYTVKKKGRIIKFSTIYFVVLALLGLILIPDGVFSVTSGEDVSFIFRIINKIILLVVFWLGSKKFIEVGVDEN